MDTNDQTTESEVSSYQDERIDPKGEYTVKAKDRFTKAESLQTGTPESKAQAESLDICGGRASEPWSICTMEGRPIKNGNGTRVNGGLPGNRACVIQEAKGNFDKTDRSWLAFEDKAKGITAEQAAETKCRLGGGIRCQIKTCFNGDDDKYDWPDRK
jgi:hypothetical protein